jgi:hypothetical protein
MSTKFVPYEKLSKKAKREADKARRTTWGELNPTTRKPENSRAYDRNADKRNWKRDANADKRNWKRDADN